MVKMDDNQSDYLTFDEQASDPSTPTTGLWRQFFKADGMYTVDDAGDVRGPLSGGLIASVGLEAASSTSQSTSASFVAITGLSDLVVPATPSGYSLVELGFSTLSVTSAAMIMCVLDSAGTTLVDQGWGAPAGSGTVRLFRVASGVTYKGGFGSTNPGGSVTMAYGGNRGPLWMAAYEI